ncbi:hypothetical protein PV08_01260 [Exophiala spinifera]|uniref:Nephrocystin 3-like N-terminal domain-containing protein n=1 Tax=Exophiala spinifera TaxID=91928 RepID=A0A0D2BP37_9EURO|nr:uncharacterized protein PV08_01260 [Exophiala spinifera]KIW20683.1 hypothetical protein PV08_01260 [Exophiala spinifera]
MIEPVTALGLVCNIFQLIEQGIEAAVACKAIYERGSLDTNNEVERYAQSISVANKDLQTILKAQEGTRAIRARRLQSIANEAFSTAEDLKKILNNLKLSKSQWKGAFKTSLKSLVNKGTIDRLRAKLEQQDAALRSALLKEQYIKALEDDRVRQKRFETLSEGHKDIIARVLQRLSQASDASLAATRASEAAITSHLNQQNVRLDKSEATIMGRFNAQEALMESQRTKTIALHDEVRESSRSHLLDSLAFAEMSERRNMIEKRVRDFGETFVWVLRGPDRIKHSPDDVCPQSDFVKWLSSGSEIFWISGKPGSGKSQLMDFIYQNLKPGNSCFTSLEAWAAPNRVHVLDFWFFKPATSVLLKTMQGFWRSLCFQILSKDKSLIQKAIHDGKIADRGSLTFRPWTDKELASWFTYLLSATEHHYLLLLDGLDESADDHEDLIRTIESLVRESKNIKICCSSRPEFLFAQSFERYPMLRLQDLNFADIESYCSRRLDKTRAAVHASNIARRAEGVFLWAYLVAEDLRRGSLQGDSDKDLEQRLSESPTEMNELFEFILKRQDRFYLKYPKPYLLLLDAAVHIGAYPSLLQLLLAARDLDVISAQVANGPDSEFLADLNESARNLEINIVASCAGLVETERDRDPMEAPYICLVEASCVGLRFIHRCVQDFLLESESGAHFLRSCGVPKKDALKRLMTASALCFVMSKASVFSHDALDYAEHTTPESWTSVQTYVLDTLFSAMYSCIPEGREMPDDSVNIECPQLSGLENLAFGHSATRKLVPYLGEKLAGLDPEGATFATGLIVALILRHSDQLHEPLAKILQQYISWTRPISLSFYAAFRLIVIAVSRPLWQHYYLCSSIKFLHHLDTAKSSPTFLDLKLRSMVLGSSDGSFPIVMAFLIAAPYWEFIPDPEDVRSDGALICHEVFKTQLLVPEYEKLDSQTVNRPTVNFEQYSPGGLARFLRIEPEMKKSLRREFDKGHFLETNEPEYLEYTMNILNDNLSVLSPTEIADIVCCGRTKLFSSGRFSCASWDEVEMWLSRLGSGDFGEDFRSDEDPVLLEILKRLSEEPLPGTPTPARVEEIEYDSGLSTEMASVNQNETVGLGESA